jgi:hypothetical protein
MTEVGFKELMQALIGEEVEVSRTTLAQCVADDCGGQHGFRPQHRGVTRMTMTALETTSGRHHLVGDTLGGEVRIPVVERSMFADSRRFTVIDSIRDTQGTLLFQPFLVYRETDGSLVFDAGDRERIRRGFTDKEAS